MKLLIGLLTLLSFSAHADLASTEDINELNTLPSPCELVCGELGIDRWWQEKSENRYNLFVTKNTRYVDEPMYFLGGLDEGNIIPETLEINGKKPWFDYFTQVFQIEKEELEKYATSIKSLKPLITQKHHSCSIIRYYSSPQTGLLAQESLMNNRDEIIKFNGKKVTIKTKEGSAEMFYVTSAQEVTPVAKLVVTNRLKELKAIGVCR